MIPDTMAGSHAYGVELDSISGRIAQQLYQNSSIAVTGFEKVQMPDSFFDVAIGNIPFGDFKVLDKRYDKHHWLIHDFFFGKTLDKVRPGGIVAFITSKGTMDKGNPAVRKYLAQRAELIGAIRLPNTAFKRNAGTEVTSDILFLQKRDHMTDIEPDWVHLDTDANGIRLNSYFVQHPEMILGEMVMESTRFGMRNVGGIAQTEAQKSSDLFMKCQYLDEITGGRGVVFATGTPISNSMVELYTIQRYLQYGTLEEIGLINFDDWAANYGETVTAIELSPEGSGYRSKTRFAKFYNLPELMSTFKMVADIQTADMLQLPVPKANFHTEVIKPSPMQEDMVKSLADRAEKIRAGDVDPSVDNMLKITNDGRKLALDMRLINPLAPDSDTSKASICARNVYSIWERTQAQRSTQLVFCDLSTPKKNLQPPEQAP